MSQSPVVTFDLFSALLDSRTGGSNALDALAAGQAVTGEQLYDAWDPRNKAAQRDCDPWQPWRVPATPAMGEALAGLEVDVDAVAAVELLVASLSTWPLWPDVAEDLPLLQGHRLGLLSNVDDDLFARTAAAPLLDPEVALTSERLGVYKPHAEIYHRAADAVAGDLVHVATSARDVRGATEAGIAVVRLRRPRQHEVDPDGPRPSYEVARVGELPDVLAALRR